MPKKRGRPTTYTKETGDKICALMKTGKTLRAICRDEDDLPDPAVIRGWAARDESGFYSQYAHARDIGLDTMSEELLEISDDERGDLSDDGKWSHANVQRARLRVDTRKWYLSKLAPKRYGEKLDVQHGGKVDGEITVKIVQFGNDDDNNPK